MAYLIDEHKLEKIYLKSYHTIGRYKFNVDTLIDQPGVSRHHAIIELAQGKWLIRDVSTNGIWINDKKIDKNLPYQLCENDKIDFAAHGQNSYVVANLSDDCQYLVSQTHSSQVIEVKDQILLPNSDDPSHIIYFDSVLNYWFLEDLTNNDRQALIDGGLVSAFNDQWLFYSASTAAMTKHLDNQPTVKPCGLTFSVSQDEESTQLSVELNNESFDLGTRTHHYLMLLLARTRIQDKHAGMELDEQGWLYREELVKALGVQMNHMNIMVHRARKQLSDAGGESNPELAYLLETNNGRVRLNSQDITIIKGSKLETRITI
jgi:pSer/pThr/pTyr-binding forkhead associated (FHA) protein